MYIDRERIINKTNILGPLKITNKLQQRVQNSLEKYFQEISKIDFDYRKMRK